MTLLSTKKIILKGGAEVIIPIIFTYDKCKKCKADDLIWATTVKNNKPMPIRWSEEEGIFISHFADCPYGPSFRK